MKKIYLLALMLVSMTTFAQETEKTEKMKVKSCEIEDGFEEPRRSKKNKKFEKRMRGNFPTLEEIKTHVAIDNDCDASEITLLRLSEQMGNGIYVYCVKGTQLKYKRMGTVIMIEGENPFKNN